ncbi:PH domain-containing protein [Bacillus bingmayongensis]|uniref:PH domain-containing protein n=1 Tax=Bacillus bingmayongensis TaxID=1150157 RepID=UPI00030D5342|nr:PH domain-containing protein [Bacillus bingmayongensis]MBY0595734.1 PH domain-containing protein [Bacillus bingmayongensis]
MKWKVHRDRGFLYIVLGLSLLPNLLLTLPLWLDPTLTSVDFIIFLSIIAVFNFFWFWITFDIRYEFREKTFYACCGPFRCNIPYEDITKINKTNDMLMGFRLSSALEGVEIHYPKALFGSVKLSPQDQDAFISLLKEKCPNLQNTPSKKEVKNS